MARRARVGQQPLTAPPGRLGIRLEPVAHAGVDQLHRVHQVIVTGDDDLRAAPVHDHRLMTRGVAWCRHHTDPAAGPPVHGGEAGGAVRLVELTR